MAISTIKFTTDHRGRPAAFYWSTCGMRWLRMGLDKAKLLIATGAATQVAA